MGIIYSMKFIERNNLVINARKIKKPSDSILKEVSNIYNCMCNQRRLKFHRSFANRILPSIMFIVALIAYKADKNGGCSIHKLVKEIINRGFVETLIEKIYGKWINKNTKIDTDIYMYAREKVYSNSGIVESFIRDLKLGWKSGYIKQEFEKGYAFIKQLNSSSYFYDYYEENSNNKGIEYLIKKFNERYTSNLKSLKIKYIKDLPFLLNKILESSILGIYEIFVENLKLEKKQLDKDAIINYVKEAVELRFAKVEEEKDVFNLGATMLENLVKCDESQEETYYPIYDEILLKNWKVSDTETTTLFEELDKIVKFFTDPVSVSHFLNYSTTNFSYDSNFDNKLRNLYDQILNKIYSSINKILLNITNELLDFFDYYVVGRMLSSSSCKDTLKRFLNLWDYNDNEEFLDNYLDSNQKNDILTAINNLVELLFNGTKLIASNTNTITILDYENYMYVVVLETLLSSLYLGTNYNPQFIVNNELIDFQFEPVENVLDRKIPIMNFNTQTIKYDIDNNTVFYTNQFRNSNIFIKMITYFNDIGIKCIEQSNINNISTSFFELPFINTLILPEKIEDENQPEKDNYTIKNKAFMKNIMYFIYDIRSGKIYVNPYMIKEKLFYLDKLSFRPQDNFSYVTITSRTNEKFSLSRLFINPGQKELFFNMANNDLFIKVSKHNLKDNSIFYVGVTKTWKTEEEQELAELLFNRFSKSGNSIENLVNNLQNENYRVTDGILIDELVRIFSKAYQIYYFIKKDWKNFKRFVYGLIPDYVLKEFTDLTETSYFARDIEKYLKIR